MSVQSSQVNTNSGVYHCAGTPYYGKTSRGEYLDEPKAIQRGYRANGGRTCSTAEAVPRPLAAMANTEPVMTASPKQFCILRSITDGDTIECERTGTVRLIGIDAPERSQRPFGTMADSALADMLPIKARLGLWKQNGFVCSPADRRLSRC